MLNNAFLNSFKYKLQWIIHSMFNHKYMYINMYETKNMSSIYASASLHSNNIFWETENVLWCMFLLRYLLHFTEV